MIKTEHKNKTYIIDNGIYKCGLSMVNGGTITKLICNGVDTQVTREGCEYWINNVDHFEQEFGKVLDFKPEIVTPDLLIVKIEAQLVSPQLKTNGGTCIVEMEFNETGKIKTKSRFQPANKICRFDKYICFKPDYYTDYDFVLSDKTKKIGAALDKSGWWRDYKNDGGGVRIQKNNRAFVVLSDKKLNNVGIYRSVNMLEIKSQKSVENATEYEDFSEMTFEVVA